MSSTSYLSSFNSTLSNRSSLLASDMAKPSDAIGAYDYRGATLYITVILIWYSTGLAMTLLFQIRPHMLQQQLSFSSSHRKVKSHRRRITNNSLINYENIEDQNTERQILNELKDPERRQRLWRIYYASPEKQNDPCSQYYQTITSDSEVIDRIKQKLADIHRVDSAKEHTSISSSNVIGTNGNRLKAFAFDSTRLLTRGFPSLRHPIISTTTNKRSALTRIPSQTDTLSVGSTIEAESLVSEKQLSVLTPSNRSEKYNTSSDRFTTEKVADTNVILTTVNDYALK